MSSSLFTARALVDEFVRGGVESVCIAPGSRSTPLALAVAERTDLRAFVVTDERSMGFFALGIARATGSPVALVTTSGTAAANLLPAVCESSLGGGALVALTADRPPELRDCAAPQTIDQVGLFGIHARWAVDVPMLDETVASARVLRSIASRAVSTAALGSGGPVHLNVPLREPFVDASFPSDLPFSIAARAGDAPFTSVIASTIPDDAEIRSLAARLAAARRGVVVCAGPALAADAIAALAMRLGWPILADPMSGMRFGPHDLSHVVDAVEPILRDDGLRRRLAPDCIFRFGLTPAPRSVQRWLDESWPAEHIVVAPEGAGWPDPARAATSIVRADPGSLASALAAFLPRESGETAWLREWQALSAAASAARSTTMKAKTTLFDGIVLDSVVRALAESGGDANLVVGNSMPVRDADAFLGASETPLRVFASRGASGIDGVLSTALGVAASSAGPTVLVVGDLSFLHDAAALAFAARERIPLAIVVVNNDGGGIFSFLPLRAELADERTARIFERLFSTPHGTDLARVSSPAGDAFERVTTRAELGPAVARAIRLSANGPAIVEVRTDREAGRLAHLAVAATMRDAASALIETDLPAAKPAGNDNDARSEDSDAVGHSTRRSA